MIVVIGAVEAAWAEGGGPSVAPSGLAAGVAVAAASAGAAVEIVTRLGEDPAGDEILLAFAAARVGHVATLRDAVHATPIAPPADEPVDPSDDFDDVDEVEAQPAPAIVPTPTGPAGPRPTLDAADVELALRYLSDYRVIVVIHPADEGIVREAVAATGWASAHLVVVTEPGAATPGDLPPDSVLLAAPDDAEAVARLLGRYAAAIDRGEAPAAAFQATLGAIG